MDLIVSKMKKDIWQEENSVQESSTSSSSPSSTQPKGTLPLQQQQQKQHNREQYHRRHLQQSQSNVKPKEASKPSNSVTAAKKQSKGVTDTQGQDTQQQQQQQQQQQRRDRPERKPRVRPNSIVSQMQQGELKPISKELVFSQQALPLQQSVINQVKRSIFSMPPPTQEQLLRRNQRNKKLEPHLLQNELQVQSKELKSKPQASQQSKKASTEQQQQGAATASEGDNSITANGDSMTTTATTDDSSTKTTTTDNKEDGLERMVGFFFCKNCKKRWKSIHVYCKPGTKVPEYGQICGNCNTECLPWKVSKPLCYTCDQQECDCEVKTQPSLEPKQVHRRDLCVKCLAGDLCA